MVICSGSLSNPWSLAATCSSSPEVFTESLPLLEETWAYTLCGSGTWENRMELGSKVVLQNPPITGYWEWGETLGKYQGRPGSRYWQRKVLEFIGNGLALGEGELPKQQVVSSSEGCHLRTKARVFPPPGCHCQLSWLMCLVHELLQWPAPSLPWLSVDPNYMFKCLSYPLQYGMITGYNCEFIFISPST